MVSYRFPCSIHIFLPLVIDKFVETSLNSMKISRPMLKRLQLLAAIVFIFLCPTIYAQNEVEFLPDDWENPAVFEKGQNLPHAFHVPYASKEDAKQDRPAKCNNYRLLNGSWKFRWVETPGQVPEEFWLPDYDVEEWAEIKVPSNWQMEGYGHPKFRNIALSFKSDPPNIPDYYNPTGCYKRKFELPREWEEKEVMLRFEGIKSASYIWVNGKRVGYNQGGLSRLSLTLHRLLKPARMICR